MEDYPIKIINGRQYRVVDEGMKMVGKRMYHVINTYRIRTPEEDAAIEREVGEIKYAIAERQYRESLEKLRNNQ